MKKQATGAYHNLPTAAKRSILKSLVIVGTANKVDEVKENYWKEASILNYYLNLSKHNVCVFVKKF